MKKKLTGIFILIFSLVSLGAIREVYKKDTKDNNGVVYVIGETTPFTGKIKDTKDRHYYLDGRPEGKWITFHPSGAMKSIENWSKGKLNGKYVIYQENGTKIMETTYSNGKDNGKYILYHLDGKVKIRGQLSNGTPYGTWDYYDEKGEHTRRSYSK